MVSVIRTVDRSCIWTHDTFDTTFSISRSVGRETCLFGVSHVIYGFDRHFHQHRCVSRQRTIQCHTRSPGRKDKPPSIKPFQLKTLDEENLYSASEALIFERIMRNLFHRAPIAC